MPESEIKFDSAANGASDIQTEFENITELMDGFYSPTQDQLMDVNSKVFLPSY